MKRVALVIATTILARSLGLADPATADRAAAAAKARADARDYVGAAAKFREAYAADPRPDFICNVGVAYQKAQELPRAQLFLSRCLERGTALGSTFIAAVRVALATIEGELKAGRYTPIDIVVEPRFATVSIDAFDPDETFDGGRTVWLRSGSHRVTVRAEGYVDQTVTANATDRTLVPLRITLARKPAEAGAGSGPAAGSGSATTGTTVGPDAPIPVPVVSPRRPSLVPAIATSIATVGFTAIAVYATIEARRHADRAAFALDTGVYEDEADSVRRWNTIFGVDLALAGVGAVASGYLWYRAVTHRHQLAARIEVSERGGAVVVGGPW